MKTSNEIEQAHTEAWDRVWYGHSLAVANADDTDPGAKERRRIEKKYGEENLPYPGSQSDFEWGRLNGRLETLGWVLVNETSFDNPRLARVLLLIGGGLGVLGLILLTLFAWFLPFVWP